MPPPLQKNNNKNKNLSPLKYPSWIIFQKEVTLLTIFVYCVRNDGKRVYQSDPSDFPRRNAVDFSSPCFITSPNFLSLNQSRRFTHARCAGHAQALRFKPPAALSPECPPHAARYQLITGNSMLESDTEVPGLESNLILPQK